MSEIVPGDRVTYEDSKSGASREGLVLRLDGDSAVVQATDSTEETIPLSRLEPVPPGD